MLWSDLIKGGAMIDGAQGLMFCAVGCSIELLIDAVRQPMLAVG